MLEKVKLALRLVTDVYDDELEELIRAALIDMGIAGVELQTSTTIPVEIPVEIGGAAEPDAVVTRAVITYCKLHFLMMADGEFDRLKKSYDEQKAQLVTATGYTNWTPGVVSA